MRITSVMRIRLILLLASAVVSFAPGLALADDEPDTTIVQPAPSGRQALGWIVGSHTLANLMARDSEGAVARLLNQPGTYVVTTRDGVFPQGWMATPTETFTDADNLIDTLNQGRLLPGVGAVILDIENWQFTPVAQQLDPGPAYDRAAAAAHAHGLKLIATPAMDLVGRLGRRSDERLFAAYLRLGLPDLAGAHADVFELQSQALEEDPAAFGNALAAAASQVRAINPEVVVFGGVSTNHSGHLVTAAQMIAAINAAPAEVQGYWLNDPAGGAYCPKCTGPYPDIAVQFLAGF